MPVLERLQIVRSVTLVISDDGTVGVEFKKRESEDHYGMCLLRRLNDWKEEKALNIDVEVV
jgi:nitrate/nitrite-specific signal transduction histidine kinase